LHPEPERLFCNSKMSHMFFGQQGMATVMVALVLLVAATFIVLFTARSAFMEQRISGNEVRAKQAMAAAQAGFDHALAHIQKNGIDHDNDGIVDRISEGPNTANWPFASRYLVVFCDHQKPEFNTAIGGQCPRAPNMAQMVCNPPLPNATHVTVFSCGWSDDNSARHLVTQLVLNAPTVSNPPSNPLISRGSVNINGAMNVINYYNNLTIWSGGGITYQSAAGKTFIRNPNRPVPPMPDAADLASYPAIPESERQVPQCDGAYVCASDHKIRGPDLIDYDINLAALSDDEFFQNFFGLPKKAYRDSIVSFAVAGAEIARIYGETNEVIWVNGDAAIHGAIGTRLEPVVLIIDGNASFGGQTRIHGIVFVSGHISGGAGSKIFGSLVVQGGVDNINGAMNIYYDPVAVMGVNNILRPASIPGSWRDWPQ